MTQADMLSINTVAAKLGLSVHQLRRWELMFGLEIKRGRGQQRQYRPEDLTVLERIKELVEQGWPTSQIRPQLEAEGLITPKLIGVPQQPGNPEMLMEAIIGLRSFSERRFIEISKQIDELRQLMISITLRNELKNEMSSPWQPVEEEFAPMPSAANMPAQEISIGPSVDVAPPPPPQMVAPAASYSLPKTSYTTIPPTPASTSLDDEGDDEDFDDEEDLGEEDGDSEEEGKGEEAELAAKPEPAFPTSPAAAAAEAPIEAPKAPTPPPQPPVTPPTPAPVPPTPPAAPAAPAIPHHGLGEVTDQNYLTVLGKALDMIGWSDEQADQYSQSTFGISHWDELGRSQAEKLIGHLIGQLK